MRLRRGNNGVGFVDCDIIWSWVEFKYVSGCKFVDWALWRGVSLPLTLSIFFKMRAEGARFFSGIATGDFRGGLGLVIKMSVSIYRSKGCTFWTYFGRIAKIFLAEV
jgi:hypothetical protein